MRAFSYPPLFRDPLFGSVGPDGTPAPSLLTANARREFHLANFHLNKPSRWPLCSATNSLPIIRAGPGLAFGATKPGLGVTVDDKVLAKYAAPR
jgi:hypothetical protein